MIRRPNVRAKSLALNVKSLSPRNQRYRPRPFKLYLKAKRCRWCQTWITYSLWAMYPGLCSACGKYLYDLEAAAEIDRNPNDSTPLWPSHLARLLNQDDEQPCVLCRMKPPLPGSDRCAGCLDLFGPE